MATADDHIDPPAACLTSREVRILMHLALGDSVKEVAVKLDLTPKSVESCKYRIMKKLGLHNRVLLCRYAILEGLIDP